MERKFFWVIGSIVVVLLIVLGFVFFLDDSVFLAPMRGLQPERGPPSLATLGGGGPGLPPTSTPPQFATTVYYFQPHAIQHYFWEHLDMGLARDDFKKIKAAGFKGVTLKVDWGSMVSSVDFNAETFVRNEENLGKFRTLVEIAEENDLIVVMSLGPRIPDDAGDFGANCGGAGVDGAGKIIEPSCGYLFPGWVTTPSVRDTFIEINKMIAFEVASYDNVKYYWLDYEHFNLATWQYGVDSVLESWRNHLQSQNPDLIYWNGRWSQNYQDWDEVVFPLPQETYDWMHDGRISAFPSYVNEVPMDYANPKFSDFRGWHDDVWLFPILDDLTTAIKEANPNMLLYYEARIIQYPTFGGPAWGSNPKDSTTLRIDEWNHVENLDAIDLVGIPGYTTYVDRVETVRDYSDFTKPFFMSEGGVASGISEQSLQEQSDFLVGLTNYLKAEQFVGMDLWTWRDSYFGGGDGFSDFGMMVVGNEQKPSLDALMQLFNSWGVDTLECAAFSQLLDGSFERNDNSWQTIGNPQFIVDSLISMTGKTSVKVDRNNYVRQITQVDNSLSAYEITLMMKAENTQVNAHVIMDWMDNYQNEISRCRYDFVVSGSYERYKFLCGVPQDAEFVEVTVYSDDFMFLDDVDLVCTNDNDYTISSKWFLIEDDVGKEIASFGEGGDIFLGGNCFVQSSCDVLSDSFIIENGLGEIVSYVDNQGNLCIETGDCSDNSISCNTQSTAFVVENDNGFGVITIDQTGDLCLIGDLIENV